MTDPGSLAMWLLPPLMLLWYGFASTQMNTAITERIIRRSPFSRRHTSVDVCAALRLVVGGVLQAAFFVALCGVGLVNWRTLLAGGFHPVPLALALPLGLGEMALSGFIVNLVLQTMQLRSGTLQPASMSEWLIVGRGGWMRGYVRTLEVLPLPWAIGAIVLYVGVEEAMFRGVLIQAAAGFGAGAAVALSTLLFVLAQTFNMPSWRNALFPVSGALVMGVVHGALYVAVPDLLPLIVAHVFMFMLAVL